MISVPSGIQTQLGEAVSAIADSDFWERWDTLVDVRGSPCLDIWWIELLIATLLLGSRFEADPRQSRY